ncbi:MAG: competence/damage-inducible protein A [Rhodoferax sp.]|jgi:molybdopterin-biosynthesis enzyme MoeA-like protein|nr:competence/damage-inducible protein A [Rhodoferax sp.]
MPVHDIRDAQARKTVPAFGLIIIGDEIMSGKRADKHLPAVIERLHARGLQLAYADYVGDSRARITSSLERAFASSDVVFSCGGIGATPDDHTRQCAALALGLGLELHPQARLLIEDRMRDVAREQGETFDPDRADNVHRLNMGVFPAGADIIPNPYNKIPGFSCDAARLTGKGAGVVHFVPGFPVMAWPMIEWVLDQHYADCFHRSPSVEKSVIAFGAMEAALTPLMEDIERRFATVRVFSLPSVDHPEYGRHIELGVKGEVADVDAAYGALLDGLRQRQVRLGPEMVRN